jgi:hypothetical protein
MIFWYFKHGGSIQPWGQIWGLLDRTALSHLMLNIQVFWGVVLHSLTT